MGEIAEMMLEGLLDCETGEYIGDVNEHIFGMQSPGFPISYEENSPSNPKNHLNEFDTGLEVPEPKVLYKCPVCHKKLKSHTGYYQHFFTKHFEQI